MVVFGILFFLVGAVFVFLGVRTPAEVDETDPEHYLRSLDEPEPEGDEFELLLQEPFITRVLRPMAGRMHGIVSGVLPGNYRDSVHEQLVYAGLTGKYRAEEVVAGQIILAGAGFVLALLLVLTGSVTGGVGILCILLLPVLGAQLPRTALRRAVDERQNAIRRDLPDTLDLLAISVEAGVGFEGALGIVCDHFHSPLADEFSRTLREMELGLPRKDAFQNLKRRTEVPELSNFVLALLQADALGIPVGRVLRTQATEMRAKRRQWAREKAAKLPVKILFPLMAFIFPSILIVIIGPGASGIFKALQ